jgi:hypothetical protein
LNHCPLSNKVRKHLLLDSTTWCVRYVLPHQLDRPLGDSSFGLGVLDVLPERIFGHHGDGVCIKVMSELALGHQDRVHELLHLRVTCLGVRKHLAYEVYGLWHFL